MVCLFMLEVSLFENFQVNVIVNGVDVCVETSVVCACTVSQSEKCW